MAPVPLANRDGRDEEADDILDNIPLPDHIIAGDSTDDDEDEDIEYGAYQLLPQEPEDTEAGDGMSDSGEVIQESGDGDMSEEQTHRLQAASSSEMEREEQREVWNKEGEKSEPMTAEEASLIKEAMRGFVLPSSCQPEWTKSVSEDKWKEELLAKLLSSK